MRSLHSSSSLLRFFKRNRKTSAHPAHGQCAPKFWCIWRKCECSRQDLNLHTLRQWNLNPSCLPVSPQERIERRERESNPRCYEAHRFSRPTPSATRTPLLVSRLRRDCICGNSGEIGLRTAFSQSTSSRLSFHLFYAAFS